MPFLLLCGMKRVCMRGRTANVFFYLGDGHVCIILLSECNSINPFNVLIRNLYAHLFYAPLYGWLAGYVVMVCVFFLSLSLHTVKVNEMI